MTVNRERVQLLVDALESGAYEQTQDSLVKDFGEDDLRYCCLGVACEVAIDNGLKGLVMEPESEGYRRADFNLDSVESAVLPSLVANWYGFGDNNPTLAIPTRVLGCNNCRVCDECENFSFAGDEATELNDGKHFNFKQIAECFRYTYLEDGGIRAVVNADG